MQTKPYMTTENRIAALLGADLGTLEKVDRLLSGAEIEPNLHRPLTVAQAARMLGKSRTTLHRWIKQGTIRAVRPEGGNQLIPFFEIERLAGKGGAA